MEENDRSRTVAATIDDHSGGIGDVAHDMDVHRSDEWVQS
jgi:hypothetical protein